MGQRSDLILSADPQLMIYYNELAVHCKPLELTIEKIDVRFISFDLK